MDVSKQKLNQPARAGGEAPEGLFGKAREAAGWAVESAAESCIQVWMHKKCAPALERCGDPSRLPPGTFRR
jgi:hypothetical protein